MLLLSSLHTCSLSSKRFRHSLPSPSRACCCVPAPPFRCDGRRRRLRRGLCQGGGGGGGAPGKRNSLPEKSSTSPGKAENNGDGVIHVHQLIGICLQDAPSLEEGAASFQDEPGALRDLACSVSKPIWVHLCVFIIEPGAMDVRPRSASTARRERLMDQLPPLSNHHVRSSSLVTDQSPSSGGGSDSQQWRGRGRGGGGGDHHRRPEEASPPQESCRQHQHYRSGSVPPGCSSCTCTGGGRGTLAPGIVRVIPPSPTIKPRPLLGRQRTLVTPPPPSKQPAVSTMTSEVDLASTPFGANQQQQQHQQQTKSTSGTPVGKQRNSWKNRANRWQWIFSSRGSKDKDTDDGGSRDSSASSSKSNPVHRNNSSGSSAGGGGGGGVKLCDLRRKSSSNNVSCPDITSALAGASALPCSSPAAAAATAASGPESPSPSSNSNSPFRVSLTSLFGRASSQPRTVRFDSVSSSDRSRVRVERSSSSSSSYGGGGRYTSRPPPSCVPPPPPPNVSSSYNPSSMLAMLAKGDTVCYDSDAERCNREVDEIMSRIPLLPEVERYRYE